jgi:hypothetical protein
MPRTSHDEQALQNSISTLSLLASLLLAYSLALTSIASVLGQSVTIFERSPTPFLPDQGAGIVAGTEARIYLARHDRKERECTVSSKDFTLTPLWDYSGREQHLASD